MHKIRIGYLLPGLVVMMVLPACISQPEPTAMVLKDPFTIEITSEDGAHVRWEGYTEGFYPGVAMTTPLGVENNTKRPWSGKVCISLLEPPPSGVALPLAERAFNLASGEGFAEPVILQLPDDFPPGIYALTLVVQQPAGSSVSVTPIQVGEGGEPGPADAWPTDVALEACQ